MKQFNFSIIHIPIFTCINCANQAHSISKYFLAIYADHIYYLTIKVHTYSNLRLFQYKVTYFYFTTDDWTLLMRTGRLINTHIFEISEITTHDTYCWIRYLSFFPGVSNWGGISNSRPSLTGNNFYYKEQRSNFYFSWKDYCLKHNASLLLFFSFYLKEWNGRNLGNFNETSLSGKSEKLKQQRIY